MDDFHLLQWVFLEEVWAAKGGGVEVVVVWGWLMKEWQVALERRIHYLYHLPQMLDPVTTPLPGMWGEEVGEV